MAENVVMADPSRRAQAETGELAKPCPSMLSLLVHLCGPVYHSRLAV